MLDWKEEDGQYYCFKDGEKVKGWIQDEKKKWYHLNDKNYKLDTGWFQTSTDNDIWFYAYIEKTEKDGDTHYTGEIATGWIQLENKWYYLYPEKVEKDGNTHYTGEMATGWIQLENKWYYLIPERTEFNGNTYYRGEMVSDVSLVINNKSYAFDKMGVMKDNCDGSLISNELVSFIAGWEAFYEKAYEDPYYPGNQSYWTIGYGTCYCAIPDAFPNGLNSICTEEQAKLWLKQEINKVAKTIKSALGDINISQQAFDCLVDIGYNAGTGALIGGNTWSAIVNKTDKIEEYLMSWNKANGSISDGLTKRCKARVNMCLNGIYDSTH